METTEILSQLEYYDGTFPRKALKAAIATRDTIIPELLKIVEETADKVEDLLDNPDYMAHIYATFLLAQFREERAYPLLIKLFSTPGEPVQELFGDVVTEDLDRILASVCGGDIEPIKTLAENEQANKYVRSAALNSLVALVAQDVKSRDEIFAYYKSLFQGKLPRNEDFIWTSLVSVSVDLYPDVVYEDIKQAFQDDLIDTLFIDLKFVDEVMRRGKENALKELNTSPRYTFISDTIAEMETWAAFQPDQPIKPLPSIPQHTGQVVRESRKIGRNEPCPCGSGLKYKRCCGK